MKVKVPTNGQVENQVEYQEVKFQFQLLFTNGTYMKLNLDMVLY